MARMKALRINTPNVVGEEFEGEIVVVNLESGYYFSLLGSARSIWKTLMEGSTTSEIISQALRREYECATVDLDAIIDSFLEELIEFEILVEADQAPAMTASDVEPQGDARATFDPPRLEKFSDLQDILLLDPIHDVDEAGWPIATDNDTLRQ